MYKRQPLQDVTATDDANAYTAAHPALTIVKSISGDDANTAPGVSVSAGVDQPVTIVVHNTGDVRLAPITVSDSVISTVTCPFAALDAGANMTCTATLSGLAAGATHVDTASATGTPVLADGTPAVGSDGQPLADLTVSDPAHAFAPATAGVTLVKSINGDDANAAPGVSVGAGSAMSVSFVVTNTGSSYLANVVVTDSDVATSAISCPGADPAATNVVPLLGPAGSATERVT